MNAEEARQYLAWSARLRRLLPAVARVESALYGGVFDSDLYEYDLDQIEDAARDLLVAVECVRRRRAHREKVAKLRDTHGRTAPEAETALRLADRLEARGPR